MRSTVSLPDQVHHAAPGVVCPRVNHQLTVCASLFALMLSANNATAQLILEEVVVTAQKRAENAIDVPISMSIETGESLEKKGILDLQTLSINTPGLYLQDGGRTSQVAMRGLGSPGLDSVESSVGFYIDGVYFGRSRLSRNPLFDMERIEVLRGPQGTLYGRNTIAGAINMLTSKPTEEFEGRILLEGGSNIDNHKVEAYVSGPIAGNLSGRLSVLNSRRGSYLTNLSDGPNGGGQDSEGYRGSLRWANDAVDVTLKYEHMNHANLGSYAQLSGNPFNAAALQGIANLDTQINDIQQVTGTGINNLGDKVGGFFTSDSGSLNATWDISDSLRLTSVTGAYEYEAQSRDYITASPVDTLTIAGLTDRYEYWSQEFRLESTGNGPFSFITGVSADNYKLTTLPRAGDRAVLNLGGAIVGGFQQGLAASPVIQAIFPGLAQNVADQFAAGLADGFTLITPGGAPDGSVSNLTQDISTWSVFAEGTWKLNEKWHITAGIRYTDEENESTFAKGTFYTNGAGDPWGTLPNGAELAASAVANDPALAGREPLLGLIYQGTLDSEVAPGLQVSGLPFVVAAPGGTPIARPDNIQEDSITPSLRIQYFASDDSMFYFSAVTGFKAAGFNSSNILPFTVEGDTFQSEEALAFEIGGKFTLGGGAGTLTAAIFRTDFDDLQVGTITAQGASSVVNAASAITQGIELDTVWRLTEAVTVGASYSYLDAHYTDSIDLNCNGYQTATRTAAGEVFGGANPPCTYRLDAQFSGNNDLQRAPEHTASAFLQHDTSFGSGWNLQSYLGLNYRDEANTSIENILRSDSTFLVNARVALYNEPGDWSLAIYGNNLTDDDGLILRQDNSGSAEKGIITTPRMWAVQFTKSF
ncbi:MAG: TonB-dependent receptor [Pseudomonadales bacterium]